MSETTKNFIRASMIYLLLGSTLGVSFLVRPELTGIFRTVHVHLNLIGWVSMMIFGVGYHILPRFSGKPLYSEILASLHFWLINIGLIGMSLFIPLAYLQRASLFSFLIILSGVLELVAMYLFVYNLWQTMQA